MVCDGGARVCLGVFMWVSPLIFLLMFRLLSNIHLSFFLGYRKIFSHAQ